MKPATPHTKHFLSTQPRRLFFRGSHYHAIMRQAIAEFALPRRLPEARVMRALIIAILALAFFVSPQISHSQTSLENAFVQLKIKDSKIVSLFDKKTNVEHVAGHGGALSDMFRIELVKGVNVDTVIKASEMRSRVIREASGRFEIEYTHSKAQAIIAAEINPNQGEIRWTIQAKPLDPALAVGSVSYPIIDTPQHDNGGVKRYLLPMYEGIFPLLTERPKQGFAYPGILFAQLIACIGQRSGFMLWTDDEKVNVKEFAYENRKTGRSVFSVTHRFPYVTGQPWVQPYQTRLSLTGPTWYDAADIYRDWVTSVPMLGRKLRDRRNDADASIIHRAPISIRQALPIDDAEVRNIPGKVKEWQKQLDAQFVMRGTQWEKHWPWFSGPDFFPPAMGEKAYRELAGELKKLNVTFLNDIHALIWAAGENSNLRRHKPTTDAQVSRIAKELEIYFVAHDGKKVCITERDGSLSSRTGNHYQICRGTDFGKTYLLRNAERLIALGATGFHSDLDIGPLPNGIDGCFNPDHGHPIPCGPWSAEVARDNFAGIQALAEQRGIKNFLLTKEHCSESLVSVLDGYLSRPYYCIEMPQVRLLAQYLFHEYISPTISGSGSFEALAAQVVYGQPPGVALDQPRDTVSIPLLRDYCHAMKGKGKEFLLYGKMKRPVIEGIPTIKVKPKDRSYVGTEVRQKSEMDIPSVLHCVWEDGEGNIGIFAVNLEDAPIELRLPAQGDGPCNVTFDEGTPSAKQQKTEPGAILAWKVPPKQLSTAVFCRSK